MSLGAVRQSSLADQAMGKLREQITAGHWPVGTKLPGETTLAKELGVGRSTVREAVRMLASAGMVRARQGAGVFVTAARPVEEWPERLRRAALADVYEVRMLVEVQAARLAARRRTDADRRAMREALEGRREAAARDDEAFVEADIALHAAIVAAAHNPVLTDLFGEFAPALRRGLVELMKLVAPRGQDPNHGDAAHAALVDAVERGEADEAARVLEDDLALTLTQLREQD